MNDHAVVIVGGDRTGQALTGELALPPGVRVAEGNLLCIHFCFEASPWENVGAKKRRRNLFRPFVAERALNANCVKSSVPRTC